MTPEKIVVSLLSAAAGVTALVSSRIHPANTTQGVAMPAIFYDVVSDVPMPPLAATSGVNSYTARIQVSCCASTYTETRALGAAVRAALHLQYGTVAGAQLVSCVLALRGPDSFEPATGVFTNPLDFSLTYRE